MCVCLLDSLVLSDNRINETTTHMPSTRGFSYGGAAVVIPENNQWRHTVLVLRPTSLIFGEF